jgi:hypothetical protein
LLFIQINPQIRIAENITIPQLAKKFMNSPKDEMIMKELERQKIEQQLHFGDFGRNIITFWNVQNYVKHFEAHVKNNPLINASDIILLAEVSAGEHTSCIELPNGYKFAAWSGAKWRNSGELRNLTSLNK